MLSGTIELVALKVLPYDGRTLTTRRPPTGTTSNVNRLRPVVFLSHSQVPSTSRVVVGIRRPPHSRGQLPNSNPFTHHTLPLLCSSLPSPLPSPSLAPRRPSADSLSFSSLVSTFPLDPSPPPVPPTSATPFLSRFPWPHAFLFRRCCYSAGRPAHDSTGIPWGWSLDAIHIPNPVSYKSFLFITWPPAFSTTFSHIFWNSSVAVSVGSAMSARISSLNSSYFFFAAFQDRGLC